MELVKLTGLLNPYQAFVAKLVVATQCQSNPFLERLIAQEEETSFPIVAKDTDSTGYMIALLLKSVITTYETQHQLKGVQFLGAASTMTFTAIRNKALIQNLVDNLDKATTPRKVVDVLNNELQSRTGLLVTLMVDDAANKIMAPAIAELLETIKTIPTITEAIWNTVHEQEKEPRRSRTWSSKSLPAFQNSLKFLEEVPKADFKKPSRDTISQRSASVSSEWDMLKMLPPPPPRRRPRTEALTRTVTSDLFSNRSRGSGSRKQSHRSKPADPTNVASSATRSGGTYPTSQKPRGDHMSELRQALQSRRRAMSMSISIKRTPTVKGPGGSQSGRG